MENGEKVKKKIKLKKKDMPPKDKICMKCRERKIKAKVKVEGRVRWLCERCATPYVEILQQKRMDQGGDYCFFLFRLFVFFFFFFCGFLFLARCFDFYLLISRLYFPEIDQLIHLGESQPPLEDEREGEGMLDLLRPTENMEDVLRDAVSRYDEQQKQTEGELPGMMMMNRNESDSSEDNIPHPEMPPPPPSNEDDDVDLHVFAAQPMRETEDNIPPPSIDDEDVDLHVFAAQPMRESEDAEAALDSLLTGV